jgi:hypothetical protein
MTVPTLPDRLRRTVWADLRPVRPLPHPALRALEVAVWAAALFLLLPALRPLRSDAHVLGWGLLAGTTTAETLAGLLLAGLALREAVPGSGLSRARAGLALTLGVSTQLAGGLLTWLRSPGLSAAAAARHSGPACFSVQGLLGLSGLGLGFWLVLRALPVRPRWAGALAGMGAALVADAVWHLICPRSDLPHVLVWHGGATVLTTGLGGLLGVFYERWTARRFRTGTA